MNKYSLMGEILLQVFTNNSEKLTRYFQAEN